MQTFTVPSRSEVSANNQQIFDNLKAGIGFVPNLYATFALSENALANYLQFQGAKNSFSKKEKEVINLVVSQINNCRYCLSAHTAIGKMNGFTDEQIIAIRKREVSFDIKIAALVNLTASIAQNKGRASDEAISQFLNSGYTKENLVDLILLIADKIIMNYLHNLTQVPIDFPIAPELELAKI